MRRVFAAFLVLVLFAGAGFAEGVPEIALEDYPRVDGSTSMIPLSRALKRLVTGCSEEEVADLTHSKTTGSFYALVDGEADILLVDWKKPHIAPVHHPESALVNNANGNDVDTVMVNGEIVVRNKKSTKIDEVALIDECQKRIEFIKSRM